MPNAERCPTCNQILVKKRPTLTQQQSRVLAFLREFIRANGYAPSQREIADHFNLRSLAGVHEHLTHLEEKGFIRREYNAERAITILDVDDFGVVAP